MSEIYTVIVGILGILAISGLFVGVTNDAVNFLNSAIGSKAASMKVILTVASVGIIIGVVTSSGMMEVARSGMFNPGLFTFHEVMMLYLGVMFANVILLDLYNSWGLPTSTTVSLIFMPAGSRNRRVDLQNLQRPRAGRLLARTIHQHLARHGYRFGHPAVGRHRLHLRYAGHVHLAHDLFVSATAVFRRYGSLSGAAPRSRRSSISPSSKG